MTDHHEDFGLDDYGFFRTRDPRPIGNAWIDHGYQATPTFEEVEPCIVCGIPMNACTDITHRLGMSVQKMPPGPHKGDERPL